MDYYTNSNRSSAPQGRKTTGFPLGLFQRKSQFGDPNSNSNSNHIAKTNTSWTGSTEDAGWEPQPEPTINTAGGWVRPTRAGWALPADKPLGDNVVATGMGQTIAGPKTKPVRAGLFKGKNSFIDSREAAKKYGGQFIFK